jgi:hypothetical protein
MEDWIEGFREAHSQLFEGIHPCNYGCGEGWRPILEELCAKIEVLDPTVRIAQIKEKFGDLRLYIDGGSEEVYDLIREAEERSSVTCEYCGAPGIKDYTRWIKTLCPACMAKRHLEYKADGLDEQ